MEAGDDRDAERGSEETKFFSSSRFRPTRLTPFKNPLGERLPKGFFDTIPRMPGVYFFEDGQGQVLYVGKAKNLRARLLSYRRAKPERITRKLVRMLNQARKIRWETHICEAAALLRENALLRELDPPFNVLNTRPESYSFIAIRVEKPGRKPPCSARTSVNIRFRLTQDPMPQDDVLYGCFKARRRIKQGYTALLRLLWAAQANRSRFSFPSRLTRPSPPYLYSSTLPPEWLSALESYLDGRSSRLLVLITERLLENDVIPRFMVPALQDDLEIAKDFFKRGPRRNWRLRLHHQIRTSVIDQLELDDLIVLDQARRGVIDRA